uniref:CSON010236 protein n=1 Tax=Culicoides sonorensis TaxID=179676 RepID=A0A336MYN9_CULSO
MSFMMMMIQLKSFFSHILCIHEVKNAFKSHNLWRNRSQYEDLWSSCESMKMREMLPTALSVGLYEFNLTFEGNHFRAYFVLQDSEVQKGNGKKLGTRHTSSNTWRRHGYKSKRYDSY